MSKLTGDYSAYLLWIVFLTTKLLTTSTWLQAFLSGLVVYAITGGWKYLYVIYLTLGRDLRSLVVLIRMRWAIYSVRRRGETLRDVFSRTVKSRGRDTQALFFEDKVWTFGDLDNYSNRVANVLLAKGVQQGDNIVLFMDSQPCYIATWLGAAKIGAATGLVNFNLRHNSLSAGILELKPKVVIVGGNFADAVEESGVMDQLPKTVHYLVGDEQLTSRRIAPGDPWTPLSKEMKDVSAFSPPPLPNPPGSRDPLLYVFTSGTTGLPKAAIITLARMIYMSSAVTYFLNVSPERERLYTPLPLYHIAGGVVGVGQLLLAGVSQVVRRKFSASQFWDDCIHYECTMVQYIGEVCRYLLVQPPRDVDRAHKVRLAIGNGIRPDVWVDFVKRFGVEQIGEFYGATESNANVCNSENRVGAIGFTSRILPFMYPVYLIRTDATTGDVIRDPKTGYCIVCDADEAGQMIGRISRSDPIRRFDGYVNREASTKKVVRDVFSKGDEWFLSGDLMVQDFEGYFYFRDRLGDTYRWRGENVSTTEVERVVNEVPGMTECAAYGVLVPGNEGRAGMLAVAMSNGHNEIAPVVSNGILPTSGGTPTKLKEAHQLALITPAILRNLPSYARPVFLRFCEKIDTTDTFKLKRLDLKKTGYDPRNIEDKIYYLDAKAGIYRLLDESVYQKIQENKLRI